MGTISFEDLCKMEGIDEETPLKMSPERFKELLDELDGNSLNTLKEKNARYATDGDCLHNFRSGAEIAGGTPAQACWGYMTKHLTALRDMVIKNDFSNREDFLEKCQDTINYIRFLWCIGNDASNSEVKNMSVDKYVEYCKTDVEATMELYTRMFKEAEPWKQCVYLTVSSDGRHTCSKTCECHQCYMDWCRHFELPR